MLGLKECVNTSSEENNKKSQAVIQRSCDKLQECVNSSIEEDERSEEMIQRSRVSLERMR